jgi:endonuclease YncB( thermonuclease family)
MELRGERGSGHIGAVFGIAVFLAFLLVATQVLVHLAATSNVTAAAFDAARRAAADGGGGCAAAPARARATLGTYGARPDVAVGCVVDGDTLRVTVRGPSPAGGLARPFVRLTSSETIERSAAVRLEVG